MRNSQNGLKVLFLPAWYPSEVSPLAGMFIREHAKAASLYNEIRVLYVYCDRSPQSKRFYRVSEEIEEGIRTIRVRYAGIPLHTRRKLGIEGQKPKGSSDSEAKSTILGKLLMAVRIVVEDLLYYWGIFSAFRKLVREGWKPDIIHAHIFTAGVPAIMLGRLYRIPVVLTEHWSGFPLHKLTLPDRLKARFAMNRAQIILPVSNNLKEAIEAYSIRNRFQVIPNAVNTAIFHPLSSQDRRGTSEVRRLLLVAPLIPIKGVPYLLEALSQVKEQGRHFSLDIVGDGPNRSAYEELTRKLGLDEIVNFHGLKSKRQVAKFMRECDFYAQPSLYETFGVTFIEAMACGKPVIAPDVGGVREIINEENGILVSAGDTQSLQKGIEYMLDNYKSYSSEKITQYARERFRYEAVGKQLDEVYQMTFDS